MPAAKTEKKTETKKQTKTVRQMASEPQGDRKIVNPYTKRFKLLRGTHQQDNEYGENQTYKTGDVVPSFEDLDKLHNTFGVGQEKFIRVDDDSKPTQEGEVNTELNAGGLSLKELQAMTFKQLKDKAVELKIDIEGAANADEALNALALELGLVD